MKNIPQYSVTLEENIPSTKAYNASRICCQRSGNNGFTFIAFSSLPLTPGMAKLCISTQCIKQIFPWNIMDSLVRYIMLCVYIGFSYVYTDSLRFSICCNKKGNIFFQYRNIFFSFYLAFPIPTISDSSPHQMGKTVTLPSYTLGFRLIHKPNSQQYAR